MSRLSFAVLAAAVMSCTSAGPKGDPGPQGPKGDTGPQGQLGPTGQAGQTGQMGQMGQMGLPGMNGGAVTVSTVPPGSVSCAAGGVQVTDADGGSAVACNGLPGIDGQPGSPGASVSVTNSTGCAFGGIEVTSGDGGVFQVCSGAPGQPGPGGDAGVPGVDGATGTILRANDFDVGSQTPAPTPQRIAVGNSFMIFNMWDLPNGSGELVTSVVAPAGVANTVEIRLDVYSVAGGLAQPTVLVGHHRLGQPVATGSAQLGAAGQTVAAGAFASFSYTFTPTAPVQPGDLLHLRIANFQPASQTFEVVGATVRFVP